MNTWDPNLSCEVPEEVDVDEEETVATVETPKPSRSRSSNSTSQVLCCMEGWACRRVSKYFCVRACVVI